MPRVVQHGVEVIDAAAALAQHGKIRIVASGPAEQHQHLVQQMRTQVVPQATTGPVLLAPAISTAAGNGRNAHGTAVAQCAFGQQRLQGEKSASKRRFWNTVAMRPALRAAASRFGFSDIQRKRLVDQRPCGQRRGARSGACCAFGTHRVHGGSSNVCGIARTCTSSAAMCRAANGDAAAPARGVCWISGAWKTRRAVADQGQLQVGAHGRAPAVRKGRVYDGWWQAKLNRCPRKQFDSRRHDRSATPATAACPDWQHIEGVRHDEQYLPHTVASALTLGLALSSSAAFSKDPAARARRPAAIRPRMLIAMTPMSL